MNQTPCPTRTGSRNNFFPFVFFPSLPFLFSFLFFHHLFLLNNSFIDILFTHYVIHLFRCTVQWVLYTFAVLYTHLPCRVLKYSVTPIRNSLLIRSHFISSPAPGNHDSPPVSMDLPILDILHDWSYTTCGLSGLECLTLHSVLGASLLQCESVLVSSPWQVTLHWVARPPLCPLINWWALR